MSKNKITIIGLGYVGLPLAIAFAEKYKVIGFDINEKRVNELNKCIDTTNEVSSVKLKNALKSSLIVTSKSDEISDSNIFIVTVPTPVSKSKIPDLSPLIKASKLVGSVLKNGDTVVYESTVYPGVTEDICVPILESNSGLKFNIDFYAGYSPERINPGDKEHTVTNIIKVVSGSTPETLNFLSKLYGSIIKAGIYEAPNIKTAEAAKVIENTQRDINIAFINELAVIFSKIGINTNEVLKAAGSKWNFLNFTPGLVGGHCIGVDPYYLAYKSAELGYTPHMILSGRRLNDSMPSFIVNQIIKKFLKSNFSIKNASALILGATFKENCPDLRNSKVVDLFNELDEFGVKVDIYDTHADSNEFKIEYGFDKLEKIDDKYNIIILAVSHNDFLGINPTNLLKENGVVYDIKGFYKDKSYNYL